MLALLGSDYNITSAPLGSGLASSGEANILMGSEVLRKASAVFWHVLGFAFWQKVTSYSSTQTARSSVRAI